MDRPRLNLADILPVWEREIPHPMHQPPLERLTWRDVDILEAPVVENLVRDRRTSAQNAFRARIVSKRST